MRHADFVHLHNHSDYSLLDGASSIEGMVRRAAELRMPALALTDHGSLFGAVEFYQEANRAGVKPIVGMEAYVTRGSRRDRTRETAHHLVLLARDERGFKNLMRLSSLAFLEGFYYKPRVDHEILSQHAEGLLALSACPKGEVATDLLANNEEAAFQTANRYREMFGAENYFLEIQNHGLAIEDEIRGKVEALARRTGIPLVATNDCHYLQHDHASAHDVLLCIQTGKSVDDANRMRYETDQVYFKSADEMRARFSDHPQALSNTIAIAERCNLKLDFGRPLLPEFPLPEGRTSAEEYLRELAAEGVRQRFSHVSDEAQKRLEYELDVICRMGFASYMLIVRDVIHFARSQGIGVGPGRGSVAGSLVAYCLGITKVDPLKHSLYFERFLNPERVSMPDIDIDFDDLRRSEVIAYVRQKYGDGSVTQIITFGTMGAKAVVRDVGRALGMAFAEVDKIAKLVPDGLGMTLERALELSPDLKSLPARGPSFARLLHSAKVLEGLARHASTHAAGVLITPGPLLDYVPLYRQKDDSITTQWDMKAVEKAGLLKMDFLGLRTLSMLEEAVQLVKRHHGVEIDLDLLPEDDPAAFRVFQDADTVAIFQFESAGMRDYLKKLKPSVFDDLVAMNALYRPGPMENIPYFIDCKHGRQVARYDHPALEPILKGTYGVFVYQEQVMAAANVLAGFSLAQGDELRRAMGKKRPEEMEAKRAEFVAGCAKNQIPRAKAEKIFATMEKFAGYGFNKCVVAETEIIDARTGERTTVGDLNRRPRPFTIHALDDELRLVPRRVVDVMANGRKPVFQVRTAQGRSIRATGNHPFFTVVGWRTVDELRAGDLVATARESFLERYESHGFVRDESVGRSGTQPAELPQGSLALEAPGDSDVLWDRIVSIETDGKAETFDLTVEEHHNFLADGFIVHNSHSAAYALLAYQSAWLKAHHPAEFMAATMTSELADSSRIATLVEECKRMKLALLPPDVNASEWRFGIENGAIRYGLGAVRNVGQAAVEGIVQARAEGGPFREFFDVAMRAGAKLNRRVLESLVGAGACDALGSDRATMFAGSARVLDQSAAIQRERSSGQSLLFGDDASALAVVAPALPMSEPWTGRERSAHEKESLGFYLTEHPLEPLRESLPEVASHTAVEALACEDQAEVRLAGLIGDLKTFATRSGRLMAGGVIEDLSGRIECTLFPDLYEAMKERLGGDEVFVISGRVEIRDLGTKVLVSEIRPYAEARETYRPVLHLEVRAEDLSVPWLERVDHVLSAHPGDCEVYLHIVMPDRSRNASRSRRYRVARGEGIVAALREDFPALRPRWGRGVP